MSYERDEGLLTTIVTTEHFTLQTARAATISQANGRASTYLGAVSSSLIALAFVGQIAGVDTVFRVFGLVLITPIVFLGVATFERTLQLAMEDVLYASRINKLRRFYFRSENTLDEYLMPPVEDGDLVAVLRQGGGHLHGHRNSLQPLMTNAGMVAVITSFLIGVLTGFVADGLGGDLRMVIPLGAVVFAVVGAAHYRHAMRAWGQVSAPDNT